ncbi:MAG: dihydroorotate dehydrogenase [Planctomycetota bacterium]|nr:dihydroorotate dehydrogenase [Planctomycetota bacterium]
MTSPHDAILATDLAGLALRTPVLLAAGTAGTLDEMADAVDLARVGGVVTKSITPLAREGNATWRMLPVEAGMLNAIGLANVGLDAFLRDVAPRAARVPTTVIGSISGFSVEDFVRVASGMADVEAIRAVELNVSCPNVKHGTEFGSDPALLAELIREVRAVLPAQRLFAKLSPIAMGPMKLSTLARAAIEPPGSSPRGPNQRPGADALCVCNTISAMAIDVTTRRPRLANVTGGLSGPALHPIAVKLVHDVYRDVARDTHTPIIGLGGVLRWEHAAEFVLAGATAVEIGTGLFVDPRSPVRVAQGLATWARAQGVARVQDLVGAVDLSPPKE